MLVLIKLKTCVNPSLAEHDMPVLANSVDPDQLTSEEANWSRSALFVIKYVNFYDQLASEEANWSGSALFVIKYVNFYQKPGSSNLIGWKLEVGVVS